MPTIRLVCWNPKVALERSRALQATGFAVDASPLEASRVIGQLRETTPAVVPIDLDRLPSHGRAVPAAMRNSKIARQIPIDSAAWLDDKLDRSSRDLPAAIVTTWTHDRPPPRPPLHAAPT